MLSLTCKASVKAVIYLGSIADKGKRVSVKEISEVINENEHTVGKLLQKLVKDGIINSSKGPNGGFYITESQKTQPVINIIHAIDGEDVFKQCGLGLSECSEERPCPIHNEYKPIREKLKNMYRKKRVCDLYGNINKGLAYLIS